MIPQMSLFELEEKMKTKGKIISELRNVVMHILDFPLQWGIISNIMEMLMILIAKLAIF